MSYPAHTVAEECSTVLTGNLHEGPIRFLLVAVEL